MSYCRMGVDGSQLYLYEDVDGGYKGWHNKGTFRYASLEDVWTFICKARQEGTRIPDYVFEEIQREMKEKQENKNYDARTTKST